MIFITHAFCVHLYLKHEGRRAGADFAALCRRLRLLDSILHLILKKQVAVYATH